MSANLPITWLDKKNSPELEAFLKQYGDQYCMKAEEINQLRDAVNEMALVQQSTFLGAAEPTFTPAGTGRAYWLAIKPGTYANHGNVVVAANEIAFIIRDAVGAFSISKTGLDLSGYLKYEIGNDDYSLAIVDLNGRLLGGYKIDGSFHAIKYEISSIDGKALKINSISLDKLDADVKSYFPSSLSSESGYVYVVVDSNDRILFGVKNDGTFVASKFFFSLPLASVDFPQLSSSVQMKINKGIGSTLIPCYGDSLTQGTGGNGTTYPSILSGLLGLGYTVVNCGVGGEASQSISARQGGVPAMIASGFVLPADTTPVVVTLKNPLGAPVNLLGAGGEGNSINPCYVQGIECTLTLNGSQLNIQRNVSASVSKSIPINSFLTTYGAKYHRQPFAFILFMGTNIGGLTDAELLNYQKRVIEYSDTKRYIVLGLHTGTSSSRAALEQLMFENFGLKYINLREYFVNYGLTDAGLTATTADNTAISQGSCPPQLMTDGIHFTAAAYTLVGQQVHKRMLELGYI